jgi:hypothetical protein
MGLIYPCFAYAYSSWRNERELFERNVGLKKRTFEFSKLSIQLHSYFCSPKKNGLYFPCLSQWFKGRRNERKLFKRNVGLKNGYVGGFGARAKLATNALPKKTYTQLVAKPLSAPL